MLRHRLHPERAGGGRACPGAAPALLLLLHGTGDTEDGLLPLATLAPEGTVVASLRAPLSAPYGGYRWFEGYSSAPEPRALESSIAAATDMLFDFIEAAPEALGTDPARVYLLGWSQGATIAWSALLSKWPRPSFIAGALALSGRLMPELLQPSTPLGQRAAPREQLRGVPVLATHGGQDMVTPVSYGQANARLFADWQRGGEGKGEGSLSFHELPHDGHQFSRKCQELAHDFLSQHLA